MRLCSGMLPEFLSLCLWYSVPFSLFYLKENATHASPLPLVNRYGMRGMQHYNLERLIQTLRTCTLCALQSDFSFFPLCGPLIFSFLIKMYKTKCLRNAHHMLHAPVATKQAIKSFVMHAWTMQRINIRASRVRKRIRSFLKPQAHNQEQSWAIERTRNRRIFSLDNFHDHFSRSLARSLSSHLSPFPLSLNGIYWRSDKHSIHSVQYLVRFFLILFFHVLWAWNCKLTTFLFSARAQVPERNANESHGWRCRRLQQP